MNEEEYQEYPVVMTDLPTTIRGFVCLGEDYEPCIVINSRMPQERQHETYLHEVSHIRTGQLYDEEYIEYAG